MEMQLYDAAMKGNKKSLLNLLQQDQQLLDRCVTGRYCETPLHVAAMFGHIEFVDEVVTRKPELAQELDSRKSSPLHVAAAKGYLQIVKRLLEVNPVMCLVCDIDGRNPLHIAAMKGHLDVLKELVHAKPWAARSLMEDGDTILHACVRCKQLEALKYLAETVVSDHDFVNCQNRGGNTVLHLAAAAKQTEVISFLISCKTVDVNHRNFDGITALDLLSQKTARDAKEEEVVNHRNSGWLRKLLNRVTKGKQKGDTSVWVEKQLETLMLVATVLAAMAFQAAINPPRFVETDKSRLATILGLDEYNAFLSSNTMAFLLSLTIIHLLISGLPLQRNFFKSILKVILWFAIDSMALAYISLISAFISNHETSDNHQHESSVQIIEVFILGWIGWWLVLLLGHAIRLIIRLIRLIIRLIKWLCNISDRMHSTDNQID